jgi:hypothetical protein
MPQNHFFVADETFGQLIDADLLHRVGMTDEPKEKDKLIPESDNKFFEKLLDELKTIDEPQVTDVIMFLMSLSQNTIDEFTRYMQAFIAKVSANEKDIEDFSATIDSDMGGFTFVCSKDENRLLKAMEILSGKNKYINKASQWLAIGTVPDGSGRIVSTIKFDKSPWQRSSKWERTIKLLQRSAKGKGVTIPIHEKKKKRKKRPRKSKKKH